MSAAVGRALVCAGLVVLSAACEAAWGQNADPREDVSAGPTPVAAGARDEAEVTPSRLMEVTASRLNVRAGPSTRTAVVGALDQGMRVRLTGEAVRRWREVTLPDGTTGWVGGRFLIPAPAGAMPSGDTAAGDTAAGVTGPTPPDDATLFCNGEGQEGTFSPTDGLRWQGLHCAIVTPVQPGLFRAVDCSRDGILLLSAVLVDVSPEAVRLQGVLSGTFPRCAASLP